MISNPRKSSVWMSPPKTAVGSYKFPASGESNGERQEVGKENKLEWVKGTGILLCCWYFDEHCC